jgi:hypothetical protein
VASKSVPVLVVEGFVDLHNNVSVTEIAPEQRPPGTPPSRSPYEIVVYGASGATLVRQGMQFVLGTGHHLPGAVTFLSSQVPVTDAEAIEILKDGKPIARRERGKYAPTVRDVKVLQEEGYEACRKEGSSVPPGCGGEQGDGGDRVTVVTWSTHYEGSSTLHAKVDFSTNGGKTWRPVFFGTNQDQVVLKSSMLMPAEEAMTRIRVNDGFNEDAATSSVFRELGGDPILRINSPTQGAEVRAGQTMLLVGTAYDAAHKLVPGERMFWYVGNTLFGTGQTLIAPAPPPGYATIRLAVKDEQGHNIERETKVQVVR